MGDVGAIEPLALLDQRFRPQHLFDRTQLDGLLEDMLFGCMGEPLLVNGRQAIAGAVDDIHEVVAAMGFAEPMRERDFGGVARALENLQGALEVTRAHEDVQVLGVAFNACVALERIGTADEHVQARTLEDIQRVAIKRTFLNGEHCRQSGRTSRAAAAHRATARGLRQHDVQGD
ncbi:MAG: hypothetical protein JO020_31570 [Chloroflexi bacterium]|nr:hypothetical protein [Chloroflexota bacterium]